MKTIWGWLAAVCLLVLASNAGANPGAPSISSQPVGQSVQIGATTSFEVSATGQAPLSYQWRFNGTNIAGATAAVLTLTNIQPRQWGDYNVVVNNASGSVTSIVAILVVDPDRVFRIVALQTNASIAIEHGPLTGDDRAGIAVSSANVFLTGDGTDQSGFVPVTALYPLDTLQGGAALPAFYDALVSNLRTETVYSLGNGSTPISWEFGLNFTTVNSLLEINGANGQLTGQRINLSAGIPIVDNSSGTCGIFAGYDRIVIYNGSSQRFYNIDLPSGAVSEVGTGSLSRQSSESWAFWGVAEYFNGAIHLLNPQNISSGGFSGTAIVRTRLPERTTSPILGPFGLFMDMSSFTFSVSRSRWYFHHEGTSIFRSGDESLGSAKAAFSTEGRAPYFVQEPTDLATIADSTVTLRSRAFGAQPLTYQWYFDGAPIPGATTPDLLLVNVATNQSGLYNVEVANPLGWAVSRQVRLTVYGIPQIFSHPRSISAFAGSNATFTISVSAAQPVNYQWRFGGNPLPGQTNSTLVLSNVQPSQIGFYSVAVSNRFGQTLSASAELNVVTPIDDGSIFQVTSLTTNNSRITDVYQTLNFNYSYAPLALTSQQILYSTLNRTARSSAADLSGGTLLASANFYAVMASNLRNEFAYGLGNSTRPFNNYQGGTLDTLHEINPSTGLLTGNRIALSTAISMPSINSQVGIFSGYDRIVILANGRAYDIALPGGRVTDLGPMPVPQHAFSQSGAFWGIAEHAQGITYLLYVRDFNTIVRTRVPDGITTTFATYPSLSSYMSSITASIARGRWYFSYTFSSSVFGSGNSVLGYATATFTNNPGFKVDRFELSAVAPVNTVNAFFPVTITAKTVSGQVVTNYSGPLPTLVGIGLPQGTTIPVSASFPAGFVNGVSSGLVAVSQTSTTMVLRATDVNGIAGTSAVFSVTAPDDLAVYVTDSPDPLISGTPLVYTAIVTNTGPASATGVYLTNLLPASAVFISGNSSQGSCSAQGRTVLCNLGTMPGGSRAFIQIIAGVGPAGTLTNLTTVARAEPDATPFNNVAVTFTTVTVPSISISDVSTSEGQSGTNEIAFNVFLSAPSTNTVTVTFQTVNGSATSTGTSPDYVTQAGTLSFPPGVTNRTLPVGIRGDSLYEINETFSMTLFNSVNATISDSQGVCTIINDEPIPTVSISNVSILEGNSGVVNVSFPVTLSSPSGVAILVGYRTVDGTAAAGSDFTATNGLVLFPAGNTNLTRTALVPVRGDTLVEPNETFQVHISVTNANGGITQAVCTVLADDGLGALDHFSFAPVPSPQQINTPIPAAVSARDIAENLVSNFNGTVSLSARSEPPATSIFEDLPFTSFFDGDFTLGYLFTPKSTLRVSHFRHYTGTKVSLWTEAGALLASTAVGSTPGSWRETPLSTPVTLHPGSNYIIAYYTGGMPYYFEGSVGPDQADVTLFIGRFVSGDAFPINTTDTPGWAVDMRYSLVDLAQPVPVAPVSTSPFVNGVWNGELQFSAAFSNIIVIATGQVNGRLGESQRFDVLQQVNADVRVEFAPTPRTVRMGDQLVYTIVVTNRGPGPAVGVVLSNSAPPGMSFDLVETSQGNALVAGDSVRVVLGTLPKDAEATIQATMSTSVAGTFTNRATVGGSNPDPVPQNNSALDRGTVVYEDTDGDGIWDSWEMAFDLDLHSPDDAGLDPDNDRHTNWEEFVAGTNPRNGQSVVRLLEISIQQNGIRLVFRGVRGKSYRLDRREFPSGLWQEALRFTIPPVAPGEETVVLTDPVLPTGAVRFYRIEIVED